MKILVVDDEQDICEILQYNLENEGYEVDVANSAEEAMHLQFVNVQCNNDSKPDLILLDVMMDGMSGFEMAHKLKSNPETSNIPIIFITALDDEDNTVKGLNIGGDDYIAKPLSIKEVKARVKAVLRRTVAPTLFISPDVKNSQMEETSDTTGHAQYEGIVLNTDSKTATLDGHLLTLTKLEFELLSLLLLNPNKVFSREELLKRCWPQDVYVLDRTVDVNITRLRKKLGCYGNQIKTRIGYGYIFEK